MHTHMQRPGDPVAQRAAALAEAYRLYEDDEFDAALAACDAALAWQPLSAEAHNLRGVVLEELDRESEAIAAYQEALKIEPNFAEPAENLRQIASEYGYLEEAHRLWQTGETLPALNACDKALAITPFSTEAHNLRGVLLEELGRPGDALEAYTEAARLGPDSTDANENLQGLRKEWDDLYGLVTIATSDSVLAMHILRSHLAAEGIPSYIANEEIVTVNWLYATAIGGAQLQVRRQDAELAQRILRLSQTASNSDDENAVENEDIIDAEDRAGEKGETLNVTNGDTSDMPLSTEEINALAEGCTSPGSTPANDAGTARRCPKCNSLDLTYQKYRQRLVFGAWLVLGLPLPFTLHKWRCLMCGHEWRQRP